jgi:putative NADH-flavin reductase
MEKPVIALFGGSGRTGEPFLKHASDHFRIRALVRDPHKLNVSHPELEVIKGDILNKEDVEKTISGSDAVVSLIGHVKDSPENLQVSAINLVLTAMKKHNVSRLITLTGGGVRDKANDQPGFMDKLVVFAMRNLAGKGARNALLDGIEHAQIIKKSGTDWTIVRGPMLTQNPALGKIEVGNVGMIKGFKLTREDLAIFIVNELKENKYIHKMPFVTNGK